TSVKTITCKLPRCLVAVCSVAADAYFIDQTPSAQPLFSKRFADAFQTTINTFTRAAAQERFQQFPDIKEKPAADISCGLHGSS
ncbi:hypothetical protein, partial [Kushneria marisflavi]|uniref:hypothetical protein n=1 Tax=Kushneria marisflavi TaxID=157779 RepID=UPI001B87CEF8